MRPSSSQNRLDNLFTLTLLHDRSLLAAVLGKGTGSLQLSHTPWISPRACVGPEGFSQARAAEGPVSHEYIQLNIIFLHFF